MSQITIRQIPEKLDKHLRMLAKKNNTSINKTIISLLEKSIGISKDDKKYRDLSALSGTWGEKETKEFEENVQIFNKLDDEIWQS